MKIKTPPTTMEDTMEIFTVDAFSDKPFAGNPAAVCIVKNDVQPSVMQKIAAEMNLSETAFVKVANSGDDFATCDTFDLRWFTPTCEVSLCGHATMSTAAVLFTAYNNLNITVYFNTLSGTLQAVRSGDNTVSIDLPQATMATINVPELEGLITATVGSLTVIDCQYSDSTKKLLLRLQDNVPQTQLESLSPDITAMMGVSQDMIRGVIVTVRDGIKYDFISRYFAPWNGIPEDPVTGSAHTVLAPYWSQVLNKTSLTARQCSKRGGDLKLSVTDKERVTITGNTHIVLRGTINL